MPWQASMNPTTITRMMATGDPVVRSEEGRCGKEDERAGDDGVEAPAADPVRECPEGKGGDGAADGADEQDLRDELGISSDDGDEVAGHENLDGVGLRADAEVHQDDAKDVGLAVARTSFKGAGGVSRVAS